MPCPPRGPDAIHYPDLPVPEPGQVLAVQEGVWWLRMPLPISLDHINLWLLEEPGGYALVDTGMATDAARANVGAAGGNRAGTSGR